jgi:hypothetical protein
MEKVDRKARDKFAELLRHFVAGQITNDEFENQAPLSSKDLAIGEIWWIAVWPLYDDFEEHTLTEKYRVLDDERREIAKCVLFLKTDQEYQWPRHSTLKQLLGDLRYLVSFGRVPVYSSKELLDAAAGNLEAWPFIRLKDLETARRRPPYLAGKGTLATGKIREVP